MMQNIVTDTRCLWILTIALAVSLVSGCETLNRFGEKAPAKATVTKYPVDPDIAKQTGSSYRTLKDKRGVILGDLKTGLPVPALFGGGEPAPASQGSSDGQAINTFLWRAALATVAFMPVDVADRHGGVIRTGWYEDRERPNERFKIHVFIITDDLNPDGVRVGVFREQRKNEGAPWRQVDPLSQTTERLTKIIVDRATEMKDLAVG